MKNFIIIALILVSTVSFAQNTWVKWNGHIFLKQGTDSTYWGDDAVLSTLPTIVSGASIKTINGNSLLGSGNLAIGGSSAWGGITGTLSDQTDLQTALNLKLAANGNGSSLTGLTAAQVGLGNVNNTSDANKPISTATQTALDGKQATLVSGANIKTINGASVLGSGDLVVSGSAAWGSITGTLSSQSDLQAALNSKDNSDLLAYAALGSNFKSETVGQKLFYSNTSTAMVDGQIKYTAVYLPTAATITGIKVYVRVLGNYTGDNNNRVGLYSYAGGVLTLVASSVNTSNLWTSAANAIQTIAFQTPYAASAGIYFAAFIYNQSAQTTAPSLASGVALNNAAMAGTAFGFTNSAKLHGTSTGTDLPASINMTGITASAIPSWIALY